MTAKSRGGRRTRPYAFNEHGVAMLSAVLHSPRAVNVSIEIVRAFVRLRAFLATHSALARKVASLEKRYDGQFRIVFDALRELTTPPSRPVRRIQADALPESPSSNVDVEAATQR